MGTPYKRCPRCHAPAHLETETCYQCGHRYRTRFVSNSDQTQAYGLHDKQGDAIQLDGDAPPRPFLIAMMWLAVVISVAAWNVSLDAATAGNVVAVILALILISSRSRGDRISGGIMLLLHFFAVIFFCWYQYKGN